MSASDFTSDDTDDNCDIATVESDCNLEEMKVLAKETKRVIND